MLAVCAEQSHAPGICPQLRDRIVSIEDGATLKMSIPTNGIWGTAGVGGANIDPCVWGCRGRARSLGGHARGTAALLILQCRGGHRCHPACDPGKLSCLGPEGHCKAPCRPPRHAAALWATPGRPAAAGGMMAVHCFLSLQALQGLYGVGEDDGADRHRGRRGCAPHQGTQA